MKTDSQQQSDKPFRKGNFFITSVGCIESNLTGSLYIDYFQKNGWVQVEKAKDADLVLCATCGVTEVKVKQSIRNIHALEKELSPHSFLVVAGCIPKIIGEELRKELNPQTIIADSPQKVENLIEHEISLDQAHANSVRFKYMRVRMKAVLALRRLVHFLERIKAPLPVYVRRVVDSYEDPRWYFINICSGCLHKCAFCAIKLAKGDVKSRSIDIIMREFRAGLDAGHRRIVLSGDDTGAYGKDIGTDFIELLRTMIAEPEDFQIFIRNLEPYWFLKNFDGLFESFKTGKIRAVTIPIQSGNDEILQTMKRAHKIQPLVDKLQLMMRETPHVLIMSHFMVGLPGEDRKAFKDTLNVIKKIRFEGIAPDWYSPHPQTLAAEMDNQVSKPVKLWRNYVLTANIIWTVYFNRGKFWGLR